VYKASGCRLPPVAVASGELLIVYIAEAVSQSVMPLLNAFAFMVVAEITRIGLEYTVEDDVGSDPFVVYLMVALKVTQLRVTL